jgi:hypothetical protein
MRVAQEKKQRVLLEHPLFFISGEIFTKGSISGVKGTDTKGIYEKRGNRTCRSHLSRVKLGTT